MSCMSPMTVSFLVVATPTSVLRDAKTQRRKEGMMSWNTRSEPFHLSWRLSGVLALPPLLDQSGPRAPIFAPANDPPLVQSVFVDPTSSPVLESVCPIGLPSRRRIHPTCILVGGVPKV